MTLQLDSFFPFSRKQKTQKRQWRQKKKRKEKKLSARDGPERSSDHSHNFMWVFSQRHLRVLQWKLGLPQTPKWKTVGMDKILWGAQLDGMWEMCRMCQCLGLWFKLSWDAPVQFVCCDGEPRLSGENCCLQGTPLLWKYKCTQLFVWTLHCHNT